MAAHISISGRVSTIAHHGYTRPYKQGWQSASCAGAKWRPYEIASDALPPTIEMVKQYIVAQERRIEEFKKNPPQTLTRLARYRGQQDETYTRPAEFDAEANEKRGSFSCGMGYEMEHHNRLYNMNMGLQGAERDLPVLKKRLADWKPQSDLAA
jgi:hypothetical protein